LQPHHVVPFKGSSALDLTTRHYVLPVPDNLNMSGDDY
jgi:hypothetical protein